jgi:hypothetical protein
MSKNEELQNIQGFFVYEDEDDMKECLRLVHLGVIRI